VKGVRAGKIRKGQRAKDGNLATVVGGADKESDGTYS
jgi:hypothetical protein